jgi:hypothetical protein
MIRIQPSSSDQERVLVGSDLADPAAARREVEAWVAANQYRLARGARPLAFFEDGMLVREWVLAERAPQQRRVLSPLESLMNFWRRVPELTSDYDLLEDRAA